MTRYTFDLDGTLCLTTRGDYEAASPMPERIAQVNALSEAGHHITIDTARGSGTGRAWTRITQTQLRRWGVKYDQLIVGQKPAAAVYVGDEAVNADDFFTQGHVERWPDSYFAARTGNDPRRATAFDHEDRLLVAHGIGLAGESVCDVGCSTGEFLEAIQWMGPRYGMEINDHARRLAERAGVDCSRTIATEREFFDVVIFRGTLQHVPEPFRYLRLAHRSLTPGGHLCVLATPNTDSLVYRAFGRFPPPLSDDARNYWMPSVSTLTNALQNIGFAVVATETPYLASGYARPWHDALGVARRLVLGQWVPFAFPGNIMHVIARKG